MDQDLRQLAFSKGGTKIATIEASLLTRIKLLAVTVLHPSVHVVALHSMKQDEGKTIQAFSARVKGTAQNSNLAKTCTLPTCTQSASYLDETCYHVVMSGLLDHDLKEHVLTQAMLGTVKDLPTLLMFVMAEESACANSSSIHGPKGQVSGVRRKSTYNKEKRASNTQSSSQSTTATKCRYCVQAAHGP